MQAAALQGLEMPASPGVATLDALFLSFVSQRLALYDKLGTNYTYLRC